MSDREKKTFTTELTESTEMLKALNLVTESIIGCAIEVHRVLGPGLLESAYEACLVHELQQNKHQVLRQVALPLNYKGMSIDCAYRLDLLIDDSVICELKSVDRIESIHEAQLLSYLKLTGLRLGLLMNFNVKLMHTGIRRVIL
jgi:GxxExxY protein